MEEIDDEIPSYFSMADSLRIHDQTDGNRDTSPFVSDDSESPMFMIAKWLQWFMAPRILNDETSFTAEHRRLCRWGYALWDLDHIVALDIMD